MYLYFYCFLIILVIFCWDKFFLFVKLCLFFIINIGILCMFLFFRICLCKVLMYWKLFFDVILYMRMYVVVFLSLQLWKFVYLQREFVGKQGMQGQLMILRLYRWLLMMMEGQYSFFWFVGLQFFVKQLWINCLVIEVFFIFGVFKMVSFIF